ncbi:MAG: type I-C CRISPR-associated protein Cas8c/Csd1 [Anaeromusa sp.]|uniref:type I-C CRISPR-associated protein Cas8c/Csd1 n=1 Tax=Anaeromusa sp. TaxID=1872520 RepID=UPI002B1FA855|nr:type I-C CRISPR-associated protein Cas8c/Csd1 [Anaeromusa sp.]MEA4834173.1 type I-C CRISPR-associated protein Cas8c/Csd1 [Anaeromusa sp.]
MSWVSSLCALYDANAYRAGEVEMWRRGGKPSLLTLLPISHTTVRARIEIILDQDGNFLDARILEKDEPSETIAPATEDAMSRTSTAVAPYPLFDGLKYIAGDFLDYVRLDLDTQKKIDDARNHISKCFPQYIDFLGKWCISDFAHPKVCAAHQYLSKKTVIRDLIKVKILPLDEKGFISSKQKINGEELAKATVRFRVRMKNEVVPADILCDSSNSFDSSTWLDKTVHKSFIYFYASLPSTKDLCYLNGEITRTSTLHPKKIRYDGDGTKLISANDDSNFSYRGRFNTKAQKTGYNEALSIGYDTSQKAHNALKWIVRRQGFVRDGVCVVAWENAMNDLPNFYDSAVSIMNRLPDDTDNALFNDDKSFFSETNYASAVNFNAKLDGYASKLSDTSRMVVLALDSATPGRLAMTYYKELNSSSYLNNIRKWHESCCWRHEYIKDKKRNEYEGMASIRDVALAVYGTEQGNGTTNKWIELRKNGDKQCPMLISAFDRLRPCIIEGAAIPRDIVRAAVIKASNPLAYEVNYNKVLHIACSLVKRLYWEKKQRNEEGGVIFKMELDWENTDRSYLYGRLLAVAEKVERITYEKGETRITNAERYMQAFSRTPFRTWTIIWNNIQPYMRQLKPASREYYKNMVGEITALFQYDERISNIALNGKYLIGYDCQRIGLQKYKPSLKPDVEEKKTDYIGTEE